MRPIVTALVGIAALIAAVAGLSWFVMEPGAVASGIGQPCTPFVSAGSCAWGDPGGPELSHSSAENRIDCDVENNEIDNEEDLVCALATACNTKGYANPNCDEYPDSVCDDYVAAALALPGAPTRDEIWYCISSECAGGYDLRPGVVGHGYDCDEIMDAVAPANGFADWDRAFEYGWFSDPDSPAGCYEKATVYGIDTDKCRSCAQYAYEVVGNGAAYNSGLAGAASCVVGACSSPCSGPNNCKGVWALDADWFDADGRIDEDACIYDNQDCAIGINPITVPNVCVIDNSVTCKRWWANSSSTNSGLPDCGPCDNTGTTADDCPGWL